MADPPTPSSSAPSKDNSDNDDETDSKDNNNNNNNNNNNVTDSIAPLEEDLQKLQIAEAESQIAAMEEALEIMQQQQKLSEASGGTSQEQQQHHETMVMLMEMVQAGLVEPQVLLDLDASFQTYQQARKDREDSLNATEEHATASCDEMKESIATLRETVDNMKEATAERDALIAIAAKATKEEEEVPLDKIEEGDDQDDN